MIKMVYKAVCKMCGKEYDFIYLYDFSIFKKEIKLGKEIYILNDSEIIKNECPFCASKDFRIRFKGFKRFYSK